MHGEYQNGANRASPADKSSADGLQLQSMHALSATAADYADPSDVNGEFDESAAAGPTAHKIKRKRFDADPMEAGGGLVKYKQHHHHQQHQGDTFEGGRSMDDASMLGGEEQQQQQQYGRMMGGGNVTVAGGGSAAGAVAGGTGSSGLEVGDVGGRIAAGSGTDEGTGSSNINYASSDDLNQTNLGGEAGDKGGLSGSDDESTGE